MVLLFFIQRLRQTFKLISEVSLLISTGKNKSIVLGLQGSNLIPYRFVKAFNSDVICQPKLRNSSHNYKYTKLRSTHIMLYIQENLLRGNYILWMYWKVAMEFFLWHIVYLRVTDYRGKKCWPGTWFRWSIFDWMLRCGRGLSRLIGKVLYRSSKKSMSFSPEGSILIFFIKITRKKADT